ncbi:FKBP-type peptidyl-prolyl cis-trans isomerase [Mariniphaga sp.]|uniref:FKBP-type peptidyl-prolyl cis-trans isomerase n=1 Tax=Mariniphaga sp. TaxID=1954475 RepID=UPI00356ADA12
MKIKLLMNLLIAVMVALVISSCLKTEDEKVYTAAEEIMLREAYLDTLAARGHDIDTLENEIYYVMMDDESEGDLAKAGDTLTIGYAGYFIDGVLFDSSELSSTNGKMTFILEHEEHRMIPGFETAMKVLNKGARAQFIIPSELAYGSSGSGRIPPYQTLIFVIKMYEIKPS